MKLLIGMVAAVIVAALIIFIPLLLVWAVAQLTHVVPTYGFLDWLAAVVVLLMLGSVTRSNI